MTEVHPGVQDTYVHCLSISSALFFFFFFLFFFFFFFFFFLFFFFFFFFWCHKSCVAVEGSAIDLASSSDDDSYYHDRGDADTQESTAHKDVFPSRNADSNNVTAMSSNLAYLPGPSTYTSRRVPRHKVPNPCATFICRSHQGPETNGQQQRRSHPSHALPGEERSGPASGLLGLAGHGAVLDALASERVAAVLSQ